MNGDAYGPLAPSLEIKHFWTLKSCWDSGYCQLVLRFIRPNLHFSALVDFFTRVLNYFQPRIVKSALYKFALGDSLLQYISNAINISARDDIMNNAFGKYTHSAGAYVSIPRSTRYYDLSKDP